MSAEDIDKLKKVIAEQVLIHRGYDEYPRDHYEWNFDEYESQANMVLEDVSIMVDYMLNNMVIEEETQTQTPEDSLVNSSVTIFASLTPMVWGENGKREFLRPLTVKDLKDFVDHLNTIEASDDEELEGELFFSKDVKQASIDRITCGDCGDKDYIVDDHVCNRNCVP